MHQLNQALQAGYAAFQRGDLVTARRKLSGFEHPKAVHLLALVEKAAGNQETAASLFARAVSDDPNDPEIANNQAVLAMQMGQLEMAERAFRRALAIKANFQQAATGLGRLLIDAKRWEDAAAVYAPLLASAPQDPVVRYGYASVQLETGAVESAEATFDALINSGDDAAAIIFMRARARLELGRTEEAIDDLRKSFADGPNDVCLRVYAGALWMTTRGQGLVRYRDGQFRTLTTAHGLFDNIIHHLVEDEQGWFWMTTNRGIFRVRKDELHAVADGTASFVTSVVYSAADGLVSVENNSGFPGPWTSNDGRF